MNFVVAKVEVGVFDPSVLSGQLEQRSAGINWNVNTCRGFHLCQVTRNKYSQVLVIVLVAQYSVAPCSILHSDAVLKYDILLSSTHYVAQCSSLLGESKSNAGQYCYFGL